MKENVSGCFFNTVYTSIGRHTFGYAAPQIWNAINL